MVLPNVSTGHGPTFVSTYRTSHIGRVGGHTPPYSLRYSPPPMPGSSTAYVSVQTGVARSRYRTSHSRWVAAVQPMPVPDIA
eukprot:2698302-Rhodomonas_salina.3